MNDLPEDAVGESKSARKRALKDLQKLAESLSALSAGELRRLEADVDLQAALDELSRIRAGGARKRQLKYCTRLLEHSAHDHLATYVDDRRAASLEVNQRFHELEAWRDRLVTEGDAALGDLLAAFPRADRQALRLAVRNAQREAGEGKPPGAARKLFKMLRALQEADAQA